MFWIKRLVSRWADEGREYARAVPEYRNGAMKNRISSDRDSDVESFKNPMHITLYNAVGGRIVKFSRWDRNTETNHETTYIVGNEVNFEEALGKFIALEAIKHVD